MSENLVSVPAEPTLEMCVAYMRTLRFGKRDIERWTEYLRTHLGGPHECGFVSGLRAAIAAGAGLPEPKRARAKEAHTTP